MEWRAIVRHMRQNKPIPDFTQEAIDLFWSKIDQKSEEECWLWNSTSNSGDPTKNYGVFIVDRKTRYTATRACYKIFYGVDPGELVVRHKCDNPPCVNPHHLELGTYQDNSHDALKRERYTNRFKLSQVDDIRRRARAGENIHLIADDYSVSSSLIRGALTTRYQFATEPPVHEFKDEIFVCKLSKEEVEKVKERLKHPRHGLHTELATEFGVTSSYIGKIAKGVITFPEYDVYWRVVKGKTNKQEPRRGYTKRPKTIKPAPISDEQVRDIRNRIKSGEYYIWIRRHDYPFLSSVMFKRIALGEVGLLDDCPGVDPELVTQCPWIWDHETNRSVRSL